MSGMHMPTELRSCTHSLGIPIRDLEAAREGPPRAAWPLIKVDLGDTPLGPLEPPTKRGARSTAAVALPFEHVDEPAATVPHQVVQDVELGPCGRCHPSGVLA
jgi:hypothetical protein